MLQIEGRLVHVQNFGGWQAVSLGGGVTVMEKREILVKTGNFGRVGDESMFKMYKKAGVGRKGDI